MTDIPGQPNVPEPNDIPGAESPGTPPTGGVPPGQPPTDPTVPGSPSPDGTPPEPPSGRSAATNWLLAAILVTLVAIVAVLIFNSGDDESPSPTASIPTIESTTTEGDATTTTVAGDTTTTTPETTTTVAETTTTVAETTTTVFEAPTDATEAATAWIAAINAGDADLAFALMAPLSQEAAGGREGFDDMFTDLEEGWGAWANATDPNGEGSPWIYTNQIDGEVAVVTLAGTVTQEGTEAQRAAALPVMTSNGSALVQPFLRGDQIEFVVPEGGAEPSVVFPDPVFEVIVPGQPTVQFFVAEEAIESQTTPANGGTSVAVAGPVTGLEVGSFEVLTVVYLEEGIVHADAVLMIIGETS